MPSTHEQIAARQRLVGLQRLTDSTPATCPDCGLTLPRGRTIEGRCRDCWLDYKLRQGSSGSRSSQQDSEECRCCGKRKPIRARGMCQACYRKWRRMGAPLDAWGDADIQKLKREILG